MKINDVTLTISAVRRSQYPTDNKCEFLLVGRSNVGKSSFINTITNNKKMARVSNTPGKTRNLNFYLLNKRFYFVDVPGYGYARRSDKEIIEFGEMMDEYFTQREALKLCVMILDIRRTPNQDDIDMYNYLKDLEIPVLFVLNKCDKFSNNQRINQMKVIYKTLGIEQAICISCLKGVNIDVVARSIESLIKEYDE